jgi:hypothetical protein
MGSVGLFATVWDRSETPDLTKGKLKKLGEIVGICLLAVSIDLKIGT